jgi:hypothetical protein
MSLLHSGPFQRLFSYVCPFWIFAATPSMPCPWCPCPLPHVTPALRVIPLRAAANFFRHPPLLWVPFFRFPWRPAATCWLLCRFLSTPMSFTAASSLGTSSCTASDPTSKDVGALLSRQASVVSWQAVSHFARPPFLPSRHPSSHFWLLFNSGSNSSWFSSKVPQIVSQRLSST